MSFFRFHILITPFVLFLPLYYVLLPFPHSDYSFCVIFAIVLCPSSVYKLWLLLLCYFCHCIMSFFRLQIMITPFVLFLPLYYVLLPFTHSDYSFCVIFAIVLCPSSVYKLWLLLLCYFCQCIMSFFRLQIMITPFVLFLPLYYVLLPFTHSDYSFWLIFAIAASPSSGYRFWLLLLCYFCNCIMSFFRLQIMITPFVLFLPLYYVLLPFTNSDYSFCVIFAIVLCPSSVYTFWLLLLTYFCHCSISFFRIQILITPFVLFLPLYYVLLPFTNSNYSFCDILPLYYVLLLFIDPVTPFVLFLPLQHLLLPDTDSDYSFCDISAIVLCPSSVWKLWLLLLCYVCHCFMSFFRLQIQITHFVLFLPLYYLLLPITDSDYSFCVIYAIVLCPSSVYRFWLLLLCYFCHCSISFFRLQILISPFYFIFAIVLCPSSVYTFWLLLLTYFCHCSISFFRIQILITPFVLFLPLYYVLLLFTDSDYSFCVIFATAASPSSGYRFWLLLLCYFCHCIMSFFRLQILITPFVLFLPLYYVLLPFTHSDYSFCVIFAIVLCPSSGFTDSDYSFCVIFAIVLCPSSVYRFWLLLLCYFCHCSISFFRLQILIIPFVLFLPLYYVLLLFTNYDYSFSVILPLYYVLLPFPHSDYSFCVIFAIVLCPSSVYKLWLLLLCYFCHCIMSFFRLQIMITPFVLFLPLYYVILPFTHSDYSFWLIFAIAASPSSWYIFWLLLLCYFCNCIMSFFCLQILITPFVLSLLLQHLLLPDTDSDYSFVLFLPLYYVLLLFTDSDYSFWVIFATAASHSSGYRFWLLLLYYFCHCIMSFFCVQILFTPFVLFLPLQHLLLPDTDSDYSFCVIFAIVLCPSSVYRFWLLLLCYFCHCSISFFRLQILITPFVLVLPLQHLLLPFPHSDYSFCVIFAIVLCPSSVYRFWLLLLCYFCYCSISFFRIQILITPLCYFCHCIMSFFCLQILITLFELFLPLQHLLLPGTDSDYSFCVIFAIVLCPSSVYRSCLPLLCYFCHCIMSFFCLQILITLFELFLPLQHLLLPVTDSDYSFCVSFAIVLCPSSVSTFWLLLLCYFCHCIMSFFRFHILITPFVLFLPLYYVLLPFTNYDYSFCVIFAFVLCPSSVYKLWLLPLCYFCHCIMSFFRLHILITPFVLFLPLYYVLLPFTNYDYSFCVIFANVLCPSSVYKLWLLLLCYFCHCIMSFFRLHILITPFDLFLLLQHLLLPDTDSDYSFCVIFAIVLCPSSVYKLWLLLLCYFCHCIMSFFRLQILITPFVLFLPLYYVLLPFTHSDYSFWLIFAIAASPSCEYRFWLLLLSYFCHCIMSFFRLQILITPFVIFCHCIMSFFCL